MQEKANKINFEKLKKLILNFLKIFNLIKNLINKFFENFVNFNFVFYFIK